MKVFDVSTLVIVVSSSAFVRTTVPVWRLFKTPVANSITVHSTVTDFAKLDSCRVSCKFVDDVNAALNMCRFSRASLSLLCVVYITIDRDVVTLDIVMLIVVPSLEAIV